MTSSDIHDDVRAFYREAARTGARELAADERWGASRYDNDTLAQAPSAAADLSMGCGNPHAMADLQRGETILDLGSGAGLDVILSAKRVGPTGKAYGIDFLDEMLDIARANAAEAGVSNAEFLRGMIENIPLPAASVDVVISNCVINLAPDKVPVFAEIARVLRPGGRVAIFDVVAEDGIDVVADKNVADKDVADKDVADKDVADKDVAASTDGAEWAGCGAGALQHDVYLQILAAAGLVEPSIQYTHDTGHGRHGAIVRARRP